MARKFRITGTASFQFSKVVEVDEEDDPENYDPQLYMDEVIDHATGRHEQVDIDDCVEVKGKAAANG
jgi:hypothetical protein